MGTEGKSAAPRASGPSACSRPRAQDPIIAQKGTFPMLHRVAQVGYNHLYRDETEFM